MNDAEFIERSDLTLSKVAKWLEDLDPDEVDYTTADGVVTIEFAGGAKALMDSITVGTHRAGYGSTTRTVTNCFRAWPRRYPSNSDIRWNPFSQQDLR
jgi:hypothetical protein